MALVRILVDGYSLLHAWAELAPGSARHSAGARDALVTRLTQYSDAVGTPLTIVFDGQGAPSGTPRPASSRLVEILFSPQGRTADDLIERAAYRLRAFGEVLVVTNDSAERETVASFGVHVSSCSSFINEVEATVGEQKVHLKHLNRQERDRWQRR